MVYVTLVIVFAIFLLLKWGFAGDKRGIEAEGARPCPNCGYDLRGGHERCPECGGPVPIHRDDDDSGGVCDDMFLTTPLEPRTPRLDEKLVRVCNLSNMVEAMFFTQLLENHGIIAIREGQPSPTDYQPVAMRLMVWTDDGETAAALVAEVHRRRAAYRGIKAYS